MSGAIVGAVLLVLPAAVSGCFLADCVFPESVCGVVFHADFGVRDRARVFVRVGFWGHAESMSPEGVIAA
jgi:hypothetical protein